MKIAVVDDDKIIRNGLCKMISNLFNQHEVVGSFQNGKAALDFFKENDVDLVITDIKMPVMTGIELIRDSIEYLDKAPLFIVLSGYDEFSYVRDTMKLGAFNYLLKPIKKSGLKELIEEAEKKLHDNNKNSIIINKSLNILRRDFFSNMLFQEKKHIRIYETEEFDNLGFNEHTLYKLIVIERCRNKEDIILKEYIKEIVNEHSNIEYVYFDDEDSEYLILFFIRQKENNDNNDIENYINGKLVCFTESRRNILSFSQVENIYNIKSQKKLADEIKGNFYKENNGKVFYLNEDSNIESLFKNEDEDYNSIAIKMTKEYIMNNFMKNITLGDLAKRVFLSQNYLSELFKKETGEGFYEFLSKCRIEKAKQILLTTNLRIYEVGKKVGYNDSITFGRAFKKMTGTTPNKFRNDNSVIQD